MKITLNKTPEQTELIKLMGSSNRQKAIEAQETFAAAIAPLALQVLQQANVISAVYKDIPYDEFTNPTVPLDLYFDVKEKGYIKVWSQTMPGGLATSQVSGNGDLPVSTYSLTSAVSFLRSYARQGRLDVVAKTIERMAGEILVKQEINSVNPLLKAVAEATFDKAGVTTYHVIRTNTANQLALDDFNRLLTLAARINSSWVGGTPVGAPRGLTDLIISPEALEEIRAMAYNPMYFGSKTDIPATEQFRNAIYNSAGIPTLYGIGFIVCYEMGVGQAYNTIFDNYAGSTLYPGHGGSGTSAFDGSTEEVLVGVDRSREALVSPIMVSAESNGTLTVMPDDQFYASRSEKIGFWGRVTRGNAVLDARALTALVM